MFSGLTDKIRLLLAVAGLGAVVFMGGTTWLLTADDDAEPASPLAFYMEYKLERTGAPIGDPGLHPIVAAGRWWYEAPGKSRVETTGNDPLLGPAEFVNASDGSTGRIYDWTTNTYRSTPLGPAGRHPMGSGPISPTWATMPVGPLGFASLDEALQRLSRGGLVTRRGGETILGRWTEVYVIERSVTGPPDGLPWRVRDTYWIEPKPLAILKATAEGSNGGLLTVVATKLEYRRSIDDDIFTLKQPADSLDVSATPEPSTSSMGESIVPEPFLTATYVPEGFRWTKSSGSPAISHTQEFRSEGGGYLKIDQRYRHGGWPQNVPLPGTEMPDSRISVWVVRKSGPLVLLGVHGDIIVRIEAEGIPYSPATSVLAFLR